MESHGEKRFRLVIQYDGTDFFGWQIQKSERTVQGELEAALERLTETRCPVLGSGRTDRGVHATGQVGTVSLPPHWTSEKLIRALNAVLPADVWISSVDPAPSEFHPRYDAVERSYEYRVATAPEGRSPFHRKWCWPLECEVDLELLRAAAGATAGTHAFGAFAKAGQPERGERCTVYSASWAPWESMGFRFRITADRYLHHMVRYLVGTMVDIARGRRPLRDMTGLLVGDDELVTSPPAPPQGLYLTHVEYGSGAEFATRTAKADSAS